ncbi:hypothetical protein, partial [Streptomyces griseus]|uniref:hypothetical protein n=1 Tax=Streptomyces griseus TaxID=1911 RepID=UPI0033B0EC76
MPDTTPDRPADQLRAAAERARETGDPLHLVAAGLLEVTAQSAPAACVDETARAALAVARQLLGTSTGETTAEPGAQPADPKQPAHDAVFAYIRSQPRDFLPTTVVERNAIIWRAVNAALDAAPPVPADRAAVLEGPTPVSRATTLSELADEQTQLAVADDLGRRRGMATARRQFVTGLRRLAGEAAAGAHQTTEAHPPSIEYIAEVL